MAGIGGKIPQKRNGWGIDDGPAMGIFTAQDNSIVADRDPGIVEPDHIPESGGRFDLRKMPYPGSIHDSYATIGADCDHVIEVGVNPKPGPGIRRRQGLCLNGDLLGHPGDSSIKPGWNQVGGEVVEDEVLSITGQMVGNDFPDLKIRCCLEGVCAQ